MQVFTERRLLQLAVTIACLVPLSAGWAGIVKGPVLFAIQCSGEACISLDSHFRYLSGLLLAIGLTFLAMVPRIESHSVKFRTLAFLIVIGGGARVFSLMQVGTPDLPDTLAIGMELIVVPALALWQGRVARRMKSLTLP